MSPGGISEYDPNIKMCKDLIKSSARKIKESVLKVLVLYTPEHLLEVERRHLGNIFFTRPCYLP